MRHARALLGSAMLVAVLAAAVLGATATSAQAEIVVFPNGRVLAVRAIRSDGDRLVLQLRGGGVVTCPQAMVSRVAPDEVEYPEDVLDLPRMAESAQDPLVLPAPYHDLIQSSAAKHGVDAGVIDAVIKVESDYRSRAVSPKGARGLMQLLPSTGRQYGALDLFDPRVNIDAGVRHLKGLLSRFDLPLALAAYNAGEAAVARFRGIPPFKETQDYVTRILRILSRG